MLTLRILFASAVVLLGAILFACTMVLAFQGESGAAKGLGLVLAVVVLGLIALEVHAARRPWRERPLRATAPIRCMVLVAGSGFFLPEIDRVKVGATIYTTLDRRISRRIRAVVPALMRQMQADPAFARMKARSIDGVRFLEYVPGASPAGAIVFLHGNGGNSPLMPFAWKPFADRHNLAILCPSYGLGFWDEASATTVEQVRRHAVEILRVPADRVWLGGISDGGKGVTHAAIRSPKAYRGLIYLSPTMTDYRGVPYLSATRMQQELSTFSFADGWKGRPVIVFQGGKDINVARTSVDRAVDTLRTRDVDVTYHRDRYAAEDHFLFFGRRDDVFADLSAWMFPPADPSL